MITMSSVVEAYKQEAGSLTALSPATRRAVVSDLNVLYEYIQDNSKKEFGNTTPDELSQFKALLMEYISKAEKLSTKKRRTYTLKLLINYMVDQGVIKNDEMKFLSLTGGEKLLDKKESGRQQQRDTAQKSSSDDYQEDLVPDKIMSSNTVRILLF